MHEKLTGLLAISPSLDDSVASTGIRRSRPPQLHGQGVGSSYEAVVALLSLAHYPNFTLLAALTFER